MNTSRISFLVVILAMAFVLTNCTKEEMDGCQDSIMPPIEGRFVLDVNIQYADSVPYTSGATLIIHKKYCDGTTKGVFEEHGATDNTGYWNPAYQYTYKFENLEDKVTVAWYVSEPNGGGRATYEEFYYVDVSNANYYIDKTYFITLPFPSTP